MKKNPESWQEIQDYLILSKILARQPRKQATVDQNDLFSDIQQLFVHFCVLKAVFPKNDCLKIEHLCPDRSFLAYQDFA